MDLNSWTPVDKARRWAVLVAGYLACFILLAVWLGLNWPWWLSLIAGIAGYFCTFYVVFTLLRSLFRR
ncbi:hypothetical protein [Deinococcus gobiensis]|uniref:Uncharacterized protein n=1 Tax=Deinococcus gobiensis (strain DSM 21396 / JCM 16679 / CGMCC 1.7299 / I-0) TaxID=745776 RepID=H8H333_DEIGI|nr:hypothetical protein [Deinococcus gobiensis]AFD27930.1 hypothetical protein DGo_PC0138 [Deinococcus gobiensis I-0]